MEMDATEALAQDSSHTEEVRESSGVINLEVILYLALVLLALILRVAQLDAVPLTNIEARQALAAWRVVSPGAAGTPIIADSPLLFTLHSLMFTLLGPSEFSARILTALAGVALMLTPLLFRDLLGKMRTFMFSLLLTFSPILLVTSRADSPVIWTMLAVAAALWGFWRYIQTREARFGVVTTVALAAMIFLTDPTGPFLALALVASALVTSWTSSRDVIETDSETPPPAQQPFISRFIAWPWLTGILISVLVIFLVSTQFLTYSAGFSTVGELLSTALSGLVTRQPFIPVFFPVLITLFYEPVIVILAIGASLWLIREGRFSTVDRFLLGWLIFATVIGLIYVGAGADNALWLSIPLAGLVSNLAARLLTKSNDTLWWSAPAWSKWLVALSVIGLLGMFSIHSQTLARSLLFSANSVLQIGSTNSISVVWVIIIILFMVIGFFLASSVWGVGTTAQGGLIGLLAFTLVTSLGGGWRVAVFSAADPVEFWNRNPTSSDVFLLRQTLIDLSRRQSGGFPMMDISVIAPQDGVIAWTLRDFSKTEYIPDVSAAKTQAIVLLPGTDSQPDLGGAYVGERFVVASAWDYQSLQPLDVPAWWLQRHTRTGGVPSDTIVLWLRQDIYNGVPFTVNQ